LNSSYSEENLFPQERDFAIGGTGLIGYFVSLYYSYPVSSVILSGAFFITRIRTCCIMALRIDLFLRIKILIRSGHDD